MDGSGWPDHDRIGRRRGDGRHDDAAQGDDPLERHRIKTAETIASPATKPRSRICTSSWAATSGSDAGGTGDYEVPGAFCPETLSTVADALAGTAGLILDAGCGPNPAVAIALARDPTRSIVALDLGWGMVRTAKSVAEGQGLGLLAVAGDVERLPFRRGAFDGTRV